MEIHGTACTLKFMEGFCGIAGHTAAALQLGIAAGCLDKVYGEYGDISSGKGYRHHFSKFDQQSRRGVWLLRCFHWYVETTVILAIYFPAQFVQTSPQPPLL